MSVEPRGPTTEAPYALLDRLGPGAAVACDLRCPNANCRNRPALAGSAKVVNSYGVRDPIPRRCPHCNVLLRVERFVDLEADRVSVEPRGPTTEELRARVLAQSECVCAETSIRHCPEHGQGDTPAAILLERPCLACNREPGERMCDLCQRLELAEVNAK